LHWLRVGFNAVGSVMIFIGFLKYYRHMIVASLASKRVEPKAAHGLHTPIESPAR
jgi:hypothetical protein